MQLDRLKKIYSKIWTEWGQIMLRKWQSWAKYFHVLAQFPFTKRKTQLFPYDLRLRIWEISKFRESPRNAWNWWQVPSQSRKRSIVTVAPEDCEKVAAKHFIEKSILLNFVNLSKTFCSNLSEKTYFCC